MDLSEDTAEVVTDQRLPGWRARLIVDEDADEPWGDALAPALLIDRSACPRIAAGVYQARHSDRIVHAWQHFTSHDLFTRYLRLQHGTTTIESAAAGDLTVLTLDTTDYRTHVGITGAANLTSEREEWQAWLDGEVYGVIVEHHTTARHCVHCGHTEPSRWVEVDASWGFYGRTYAAERALYLLRTAAHG